MSIRALPCAAALVAALAAVPAQAFERRLDERVLGLALAGDAVLVAAPDGEDAVIERIPLDGGAATEVLRRAPVNDGDRAGFTGLEASPEGYAFVFSSCCGTPGAPGTYRAMAARFGGEPREFDGCGGSGVDVEGSLALAAACRVLLLDLAADAPPVQIGPGGFAARLAGRFVSWRSRGRILVHDLDRGRVVRRIQAPGRVAHDLQEDGGVVLTVERRRLRRSSVTQVYWSGPGERSARAVRLAAAHSYHVRAAGGRIAFRRMRSAGTAAVVGLVRPRGRARIVDPRAVAGPFDFDGRRLAWVSRRDGGLVLRVKDV